MPFGTGGFGGLGATPPTTYPTAATSAPDSQGVTSLPYASDWLNQFNQNWAQQQALPVNPAGDNPQFMHPGQTVSTSYQLVPGAAGYSSDNWQSAGLASDPYAGVSATDAPGGSHTVTTESAAPAYQDFAPLIAQRDQMLPQLQNQTATQQAYDKQSGNYQWGGKMQPNYSTPGFGQIDGDFGQNSLSASLAQNPAFKGVDMSWLGGVYDPTTGGGQYGGSKNPWNV